MANSLRDQLIKAGLADQPPGKDHGRPGKPRAKTRTRPKRPPRPSTARAAVPPDPELERERRELRAMEQARLREEKQAQAAARETQQRREAARAFLLRHQQNDRAGDIPFHFQAGQRIRRLYVTAAQHRALLAGELRVAVLGKRDFLVTADRSAQALALDPDLFIHAASPADAEPPEVEDPYRDFPVPDDLMW